MAKKLPRGLTYTEKRQTYRIRFRSRHTKPGAMYRERLPENTTRVQAETYLNKLREADRLGALLWPDERRHEQEPENVYTVGDFAIEVYLPYCESKNKPRTVQRKRELLASSAPWFWDLPLDGVKKKHVKMYQAERRGEGVRARTVNLGWDTVRHLLNHALDCEFIEYPPPRVKKLPENDSKPSRWLTDAEVEKGLQNAQERGLVWHAVTMFLYDTGVRWGELRQLKWSSLDLINQVVRIESNTSKVAKEREIPLTDEVCTLLQMLPQRGDFVFMHEYKGKIVPMPDDGRIGGLYYPWEGEDQELHVGCHAWRHAFATSRLRDGVAVQKVQAWLGHSTITLTVDTYGHIQPREHREEIRRGYRPKVRHLRVVGEE